MKVLKFGGTSVGTVGSLLNVKAIVESIEAPVVVVVSALGGLTDKLIATARMAASGNTSYHDEMEAISSRHFDIIANVVAPELQGKVMQRISELLRELKRNYDGIYLLRDLPQRTLDVVVSFGERMSSVIVTAMISNSSHHDSLKIFKTEKWYSKNIADKKLTDKLIKKEFEGLDTRAVVPGFISTDRDSGEITNLGRGGSDYTAALIAAALDAEELDIWTDVDGFMTADPRIIKDAEVVGKMSFVESMELCTYGAKVIYPPTIYPVFHKNIPIKILNTFNPTAPGTLITDSDREGENPIKGVSSIKGTSLFKLTFKDKSARASLEKRAFNALSRFGVTVFPVSTTGSGESVISFAVPGSDSAAANDAISDEFAPELGARKLIATEMGENLASVAVVGEGMKDRMELGRNIRMALDREEINLEAWSEGRSDTTFSYVVPLAETEKVLRLIHPLIR